MLISAGSQGLHLPRWIVTMDAFDSCLALRRNANRILTASQGPHGKRLKLTRWGLADWLGQRHPFSFPDWKSFLSDSRSFISPHLSYKTFEGEIRDKHFWWQPLNRANSPLRERSPGKTWNWNMEGREQLKGMGKRWSKPKLAAGTWKFCFTF